MRNLLLVALCAGLAGCGANADAVPPDPPVWGRVDCQRSEGNPILLQEFEVARTVCLSQGQAAAMAGTANMPGGYGLGGAIAAGINQGVTAGQIGNATVTGCMGDRGWLLRPRSEHLAACEAIKEQRERMAAPASKPQKQLASTKPPRVLAPPAAAENK